MAAGPNPPKKSPAAESQLKKRKRLNLAEIEQGVTTFFRLGLKLITGIAIVFLVLKLVAELSNDSYMTKPFQVPGSFASDGVNGQVLAGKLTDKLTLLKAAAETNMMDLIGVTIGTRVVKDRTSDRKKAKPKLGQNTAVALGDVKEAAKVEVMGVGLSVGTLAQYLRELNLGKPKKEITGHLTIEDDSLKMTLKMTGHRTLVLSQKMAKAHKYATLDTLIEKTAASILQRLSPTLYAHYAFNEKTYQNQPHPDLFWDAYDKVNLIAKNNPHNSERALAFALWGVLMTMERSVAIENRNIWGEGGANWDDRIIDEKFDKAVNLQPDNFIIYLLWAQSMYLRAFEKELEAQTPEQFSRRESTVPSVETGEPLFLDLAALEDSEIAVTDELPEQPPEDLYQQEPIQLNVQQSYYSEESYDSLAVAAFDSAYAQKEKVVDAEKLKQSFEKIQIAIELEPDNASLVALTASLLDEIEFYLSEEAYTAIKEAIFDNMHGNVMEMPANSDNYWHISEWIEFLEYEDKYAEALELYERYKAVELDDTFETAYIHGALVANSVGAENRDAFYTHLESALQKKYWDTEEVRIFLEDDILFYDGDLAKNVQNEPRFQELLARYDMSHLLAGKN